MSFSRTARLNLARYAAGSLILLTLAGCEDYFARRDTIALSTGDAVRANIAVQTVDPWPPGFRNPNLSFNGDRMVDAIRDYKSPQARTSTAPTATTASRAPGGGGGGGGLQR